MEKILGRYAVLQRPERFAWKKIIAVIDATLAVPKRQPEKKFGLYVIRTLDLCDTGTALYRLHDFAFVARFEQALIDSILFAPVFLTLIALRWEHYFVSVRVKIR